MSSWIYDIIALAATPADAPVGIYHHLAGESSAALDPLLTAKNLGTALVVTLAHKSSPVLRASCIAFGPTYWYAGDAALIPADRGTDKGFGNFNTVRGMLIVSLVDGTTLFNTHLPLSGGLATARPLLRADMRPGRSTGYTGCGHHWWRYEPVCRADRQHHAALCARQC